MTASQWVGSALLVFPASLGLWVAWEYRQRRILRGRGIAATATVVSVSSEGLGDGTRRWTSVFEFVDAEGTARRFKRTGAWRDGEDVGVTYDPEQPARRVRITTRSTAMPGVMLGAIRTIAISMLLFLLVTSLAVGVLLVTGAWELPAGTLPT